MTAPQLHPPIWRLCEPIDGIDSAQVPSSALNQRGAPADGSESIRSHAVDPAAPRPLPDRGVPRAGSAKFQVHTDRNDDATAGHIALPSASELQRFQGADSLQVRARRKEGVEEGEEGGRGGARI